MNAIVAFLLTLRSVYPLADMQDVYKSCYQDYFGAEHMIVDSAAAARYLRYELQQMDTVLTPDYEPCGVEHRYTRVSLGLVRRGEWTERAILSANLAAAEHRDSADSIGWIRYWSAVRDSALSLYSDWHDTALIRQLDTCAMLCAPVHHSRAYRTAYRPHYRIVRTVEASKK